MDLSRNWAVGLSMSGQISRGSLPGLFMWLSSVCNDCAFSHGKSAGEHLVSRHAQGEQIDAMVRASMRRITSGAR